MPVDIFIFSVYFVSTNYPIDEYKECLALLWALFETYCDSGLMIIKKICDLKVGISLTNRFCSAPTFADDMTLLGLHASALSTLIRCAYDNCCEWRYEYHNEKSGIVVFGETPAVHGRMINTRKFFIGSSLIEEVKEYTNLGIYKNYCGSFATNVDENITKAKKKAGMLFSARFDRFGNKHAFHAFCLAQSYGT